jgi:transcription antitermination factor NusA-like protein
MTKTLTTEAMQEIYEAAVHVEAVGDDQDACFELLCKLEDVGGTGATIRKLIDMVRAATREVSNDA